MAVNDMDDSKSSDKGGKSLLYDPTFRSIATQVILVLVIVWLGYSMVINAKHNLEEQNIASGFGFLENTAGFGIGATLGTAVMAYEEASPFIDVFWVGFINTMIVGLIGIFFATILGFIVGVARLSNNWVVAKMAYVYVEVIRNIPLLLQIFFWYFAALRALPSPRQSLEAGDSFFLNTRGLFAPRPIFGDGSGWILGALLVAIGLSFALFKWAKARQAKTGQQFPTFWTSIGLMVILPLIVFLLLGAPLTFDISELKGFNFRGGMVIIPEFLALVFALSIYTAAFIAEIVRAGILAVSHGQTEAAHALGIRQGPTLRLVVIPQAMRVIIPPLTSQYLNLTKNSSLAVAIAYPDLTSVFAGTSLNQTGQAVEILIMTLAVYLTFSIVTSLAMNWYNSKNALIER